MESGSGSLITRRLLDPSTVGTHSLRVVATDSGKPQLTGTCEHTSLSVSLSVTWVDQSKTVEVRIMKFSPYSSPITLFFVE